MCELVMVGAAILAIYRIADTDEQSTVIWTALGIAACIGALALPFPYVRVAIGFALVLAAMFGYKLIADR